MGEVAARVSVCWPGWATGRQATKPCWPAPSFSLIPFPHSPNPLSTTVCWALVDSRLQSPAQGHRAEVRG